MGSMHSKIRDDLENKTSITDFSKSEVESICASYHFYQGMTAGHFIGDYECVRLSSPSTVTRISFAVYRTVNSFNNEYDNIGTLVYYFNASGQKITERDVELERQREQQRRQQEQEQKRLEFEERARREARRIEAQEKAQREEKARKESEERARREAEERTRKEAQEKAKRKAKEKAKKEVIEERTRKESDEKMRTQFNKVTELLVPELSTLHEKKRQQIIKNKTQEESSQSLVTSKQMYYSKNSFMDELAKKAAYKEYKEGQSKWDQAWGDEENGKMEDAKTKFEMAKQKFQEAIHIEQQRLEPDMEEYKKAYEVTELKIHGNLKCNKANLALSSAIAKADLSQDFALANDYKQAQKLYVEARKDFLEAKAAFSEGLARGQDKRFSECIDLIDDAIAVIDSHMMTIANNLLGQLTTLDKDITDTKDKENELSDQLKYAPEYYFQLVASFK